MTGAIMLPAVMMSAGFAASGPTAGSIAAWWQSTYGGIVTSKSTFAILQSLSMAYGGNLPLSFGAAFGGGAMAIVRRSRL